MLVRGTATPWPSHAATRALTTRANSRQVLEAFGCGTAAVVSPVKLVHYEGEDLPIPVDETLRAGPLAHKLWDYITGVQDGRIKDELGWTVRID